MFNIYYRLTKPGIVYGNAMTAAAGFLFASKWHGKWELLVVTLLGLCLIIAAACVCNNYLDRGLDAKMARTKKRALVEGSISPRSALVYAAVLGLVGCFLLGHYTNPLTLTIALVGFVVYVVFYGIGKRRSVHGTIIGSISGAVPPVVGYCAVTNHLDGAALLIFLILVLWEMPHFYAIALYRAKDYAAAGLPVLPVKSGAHQTKVQIVIYIIAFVVATLLLSVFGYTGYIYALVMGLFGLAWIGLALKGFKAVDEAHWARQVFFFSLIITMVLSVMLALGPVLA